MECTIIASDVYSSLMQFEWDGAKNLANLRNHRIDFADVPEMFDGHSEDRWIGIGFLQNGVAVVIWTERQDDVIRIISARKANRYERQRLEQYLTY